MATYLLSLVGHVIERQRLSSAQHVALASKAVAVYKLVVQVISHLLHSCYPGFSMNSTHDNMCRADYCLFECAMLVDVLPAELC